MDKNISVFKSKRGIIMLVATIFVAVFWLLASAINVYDNKIIGAVFEILWMPMMAMLVIVPLLCVIFWRNEQWYFRTLYPICLVLHLIMVLFLVFGNTGK